MAKNVIILLVNLLRAQKDKYQQEDCMKYYYIHYNLMQIIYNHKLIQFFNMMPQNTMNILLLFY